MCAFIAQLVEHRTGIAEATGSNPVEALIFFTFTAMITLHFPLNHLIIVTSPFSKSSLLKMFSVHTKTQSSVFKFLRFQERF